MDITRIVLKKLVEMRAQKYRMTFSAAEDTGLVAIDGVPRGEVVR